MPFSARMLRKLCPWSTKTSSSGSTLAKSSRTPKRQTPQTRSTMCNHQPFPLTDVASSPTPMAQRKIASCGRSGGSVEGAASTRLFTGLSHCAVSSPAPMFRLATGGCACLSGASQRTRNRCQRREPGWKATFAHPAPRS